MTPPPDKVTTVEVDFQVRHTLLNPLKPENNVDLDCRAFPGQFPGGCGGFRRECPLGDYVHARTTSTRIGQFTEPELIF